MGLINVSKSRTLIGATNILAVIHEILALVTTRFPPPPWLCCWGQETRKSWPPLTKVIMLEYQNIHGTCRVLANKQNFI